MPTQLACGWLPCHERPCCFDADVGGKDEEGGRDRLLRSPLGRLGADPPTGEQPEHDEARNSLDQTICAEPDQRDRTRCDPGGESDSELDDVPRDPDPGEYPRPPFKSRPFSGRRPRRRERDRQRPSGAELNRARRST